MADELDNHGLDCLVGCAAVAKGGIWPSMMTRRTWRGRSTWGLRSRDENLENVRGRTATTRICSARPQNGARQLLVQARLPNTWPRMHQATSNTTVSAEEYAKCGKDWQTELRQRAREVALARELGLTVAEATPTASH